MSTLRSDALRWFSSVEGVGPPLMGRLAPSGVDPPRTPRSFAWCAGPEPARAAGGAAGGDWTLLGGGMLPEMDLNKSSMETAWIEGGGEAALFAGDCDTGGPLAAFLSIASRGLFSILSEPRSQHTHDVGTGTGLGDGQAHHTHLCRMRIKRSLVMLKGKGAAIGLEKERAWVSSEGCMESRDGKKDGDRTVPSADTTVNR